MKKSRYTAITARGVHRLFPGLHIDEPVLRLEVDEVDGPALLCEPTYPYASLLVVDGDQYHGGCPPGQGTAPDCLVVLGGSAPGFMWEPASAGLPTRCLVLAENNSRSIRIPGDIQHCQVVITQAPHLERLEVSPQMGRLVIRQASRLHVIQGQGRELDVQHLGGQAPRWLVLHHEWTFIDGWPDAHQVVYRDLPSREASYSKTRILADRHTSVTPALTTWTLADGGVQSREAWLAWVLATVDWKQALDRLRPTCAGQARRMWLLVQGLLRQADLGARFNNDYSRCLQRLDGQRFRRNRPWKRRIFREKKWGPTVLACWEACARHIPVPSVLPMTGEDQLCHLVPWAKALQERFNATLRDGFLDLLAHLEEYLPVCVEGTPVQAPCGYEDMVPSIPRLITFLVGLGERETADRLIIWLGSRQAPRRQEVNNSLVVGRQLGLPGAETALANLARHEDPRIQHWAVATLLSVETAMTEGICA